MKGKREYQQKENVSKTKAMDLLSHYFALFYLLVRSKALGPAYAGGEKIIQGHEYQR